MKARSAELQLQRHTRHLCGELTSALVHSVAEFLPPARHTEIDQDQEFKSLHTQAQDFSTAQCLIIEIVWHFQFVSATSKDRDPG